MGTKAKVEQVGKKGLYIVDSGTRTGLRIEVEIVDYKNSYGKDRWLIKPVSGNGEVWTEQNVLEN